MKLSAPTNLHPFNRADVPGRVGGKPSPTRLSGLDKSGVVYKARKASADKSRPGTAVKTGLAAIDGRPGGPSRGAKFDLDAARRQFASQAGSPTVPALPPTKAVNPASAAQTVAASASAVANRMGRVDGADELLAPEQSEAAAEKHARVQAQASKLVTQTFFAPLLKQMRDSPFKSKLFDGGRGGQAFSGMYDQRMTDQMSRGAGKKLVNAIARKLEGKSAYAKQGAVGSQLAGAGQRARADSSLLAGMKVGR